MATDLGSGKVETSMVSNKVKHKQWETMARAKTIDASSVKDDLTHTGRRQSLQVGC